MIVVRPTLPQKARKGRAPQDIYILNLKWVRHPPVEVEVVFVNVAAEVALAQRVAAHPGPVQRAGRAAGLLHPLAIAVVSVADSCLFVRQGMSFGPPCG